MSCGVCILIIAVYAPHILGRADNIRSRLSARSALLPAAEVSTGDPRPYESGKPDIVILRRMPKNRRFRRN